MRGPRLAVIVRAEDGVFQAMVLGVREDIHVYRLTGCVLRRVVRQDTAPVINTISDLAEDVFIFINASLEAINHAGVDALAEEVMRSGGGIALGTVLNPKKKATVVSRMPLANALGSETLILSREREEAVVEQYQGQDTSDVDVAEPLFAVRRSVLAAAGGLSIVSSRRMRQCLERLTECAKERQLRVLRISDAVATLL